MGAHPDIAAQIRQCGLTRQFGRQLTRARRRSETADRLQQLQESLDHDARRRVSAQNVLLRRTPIPLCSSAF